MYTVCGKLTFKELLNTFHNISYSMYLPPPPPPPQKKMFYHNFHMW